MYRCKECNSKEVQGKFWCDLNSSQILSIVEDGREENWCENCEEYTEVYDDELTKEENGNV